MVFDKELEKVGVVVRELKRPASQRVVQCWLNAKEVHWRKKRDPVYEAKLLKKFGRLNLYNPDDKVMFTVHTVNMDLENWHGYVALGVKDGDTEDDLVVPFWFELLLDLIKDKNGEVARGGRAREGAPERVTVPPCFTDDDNRQGVGY